MSIEKYLKEIDNEVAQEGLIAGAALGALALMISPFIIAGGAVTIYTIIENIKNKRKDKELTVRDWNIIRGSISSAKNITITKNAIDGINLFNSTGSELNKKLDILFNEGKNVIKKYGIEIPKNEIELINTKCSNISKETKNLRDKIDRLFKLPSDAIDATPFKNQIIKMSDILQDMNTSRLNGDDLADELLDILPMEYNTREEESLHWNRIYKIFSPFRKPYLDLIHIEEVIEKHIKIQVK